MCTNQGLVYSTWLPRAKGDDPRHPDAKLKWRGDCGGCDHDTGPFDTADDAIAAMHRSGHPAPAVVTVRAADDTGRRSSTPAASPWHGRTEPEQDRAPVVPLKARARRRPDRTIARTDLEAVGAKGRPVHANSALPASSGVRLRSSTRRTGTYSA